tara:strand:- start:3004 stop:4335 length:1332 start_codon:yes stop_codon:yes gene_type:complete
MISKLYNSWQILKTNLWFFPALMCLFYLIMTVGLYQIESLYLQNIKLPSILFSGSAEDAKSLAIVLLSSMITMATLAISITMVVLSLAATQLGPRLIRSFMSDRKTKMFISLFFGAVVTCFTLTMILHDATPKDYTPKITITAVFLICFSNLFVLLAFVHHVALSSIADEVIIKVAADLNASFDRLTISEQGTEYKEPDTSEWPKDFEHKRKRFYFERSGYVQHINYDQMMCLAQEHGLYIQIFFKAGHFLVEGEDGVRVYPKSKLNNDIEQAIRSCFIIGTTRTATQDIEYSIRHLVEIGLRAQSPGMDDNFTAITVLDHLSAAMAILFQKETPLEWREDAEGRVRIWAKQSDESEIIFSAFDQMRHSARNKPDIVYHILKKLKILCELARTKAQIQGLQNQLTEIDHDLKYVDKLVLNIEEMKALRSELQDILDNKRCSRR